MPNEEDQRQPWDRQIGEPAVWYDRFEIYLNLGPGRSVNKACQEQREQKEREKYGQLRPKGGIKRPGQAWYEQAKLWNWEARALACDDWQRSERKRKEQELEVSERQARKEAKEIRLRRAQEQIEDEWDLRNRLLQRARDMLNHPLYTRTLSDDGKTIILMPAKWNYQTMVSVVKAMSELGRGVTGLDAGVTELEAAETLARGGHLSIHKLVSMEEEVEAFQARIAEIIDSDLVVDARPGDYEIQLEEIEDD